MGGRFVDVAPAAYALLRRVSIELDRDTAHVLTSQADAAVIVGEVVGRMIDLEVPGDLDPCGSEDGPLPVIPSVTGPNGELVGEVLIWLKAGLLIGMEQLWFTDEPPSRWPSETELNFGS